MVDSGDSSTWSMRVLEPGEVLELSDGTLITEEAARAIADEFEAMDPDEVVQRILSRGRPLMGSAPAKVVPVPLEPELVAAVDERASSEGCNRSEVIRAALRAYLA